MKKSILFGVFAVAGIALLAGCHGRRGHGDPSRMVTGQVEDLLDDVKATDQQRTQILAIEQKLLAEGKGFHDQLQTGHQELFAQLKADQPDSAKVHALIDTQIDALRAFAHQAADGVLQAESVLTPEQRAQINRKIERYTAAGRDREPKH
jgi:protein CpxP